MKENDSLPNVMDIQRQVRAFSQGGGINVEPMDYTGGSEPVQVRVGLINAGFLETLSVQPMLGRIISPGEDVQGGPRLAMVSNYFWQNYLGSDPHAVGNTIHLGGKSYTVIGVMPASFAPPAEHAGVYGAPGIGDPGGAGRGTRPAHPESADRERTVVGPRRCGRITVRAVGHEHAPGPEAGEAGAAERDSHGYTGAAVRPRGLGADRHRVRNGAGMDRGSRGRCRGPERERAEHNREHDGA